MKLPLFLAACAFAGTLLSSHGQAADQPRSNTFAIAIHGGAGSAPSGFSEESNARRRASMQHALTLGTEILAKGGTALDAVEQVVEFLEDDPQFNAGKGAVFNAAGKHELDASIMDGKTLACGAVAGVATVKNPIALARLVMTRTRHVLLAGRGAEQFAREMDLPKVKNSYFSTSEARREWERVRGRNKTSFTIEREDVMKGTVGCVALDKNGNLAAGTSTGGLTDKKFGRVGDSPIVGAGTYADNRSCAVSCTGIGEQFIRHAIAYDVSARMRYAKSSLDDAVERVLTQTLNKGEGGIIALDREGNITMQFNTPGMPRAYAHSSGDSKVLWPD